MLAACTACGRLGFDPAGAPDRGSSDSGPSSGDGADVPACSSPAGHDEDSDGVDDACDVCPQLADDQRDSDGDGVGDACDLAATTQQRLLFDPFTSARADWVFDPELMLLGDVLALPGTDTNVILRLVDPPGRAVLETGGRIGTGSAAANRQLAIHIGDALATANYYCELYQQAGAELYLLLTYTRNGTNYVTIDELPIGGALDTGAFRLVFVHAPPDLRCIGWWNGTRYEVAGTDPGGIPTDVMYTNAYNVDAELDYFVRLATP